MSKTIVGHAALQTVPAGLQQLCGIHACQRTRHDFIKYQMLDQSEMDWLARGTMARNRTNAAACKEKCEATTGCFQASVLRITRVATHLTTKGAPATLTGASTFSPGRAADSCTVEDVADCELTAWGKSSVLQLAVAARSAPARSPRPSGAEKCLWRPHRRVGLQ